MQPNSAPRTELAVRGMTCSNCARHVTDALQAVPGVASASVSLEAGKATVRWASDATDSPALTRAVAQAGYEAHVATTATPAPVAHARAWGHTVLTGIIPTAVLMLGEWVFGWHHAPAFRWLSFALAGIVIAGPGRQFFLGAWRQLKVRSSNMDTLVALGSTTAFVYSAWILLGGRPGHLYFMEAAAIVTLISVGHWLEARVSARASASLRGLLELAPDIATLRAPDGTETSVPVAQLQPGDTIVLRPGERIPTDSEIVEGASAVDESMLTGESMPVEKSPGARLFAGTLNHNGCLVARVTGVGEATALAHIIAAVTRAQNSRADIQRLGDRVSSVFVPIVVLIALGAALWWGLAPEHARNLHAALAPAWWRAVPAIGALDGAIFIACAVLIVACPCAMGLATPAAIMAGANAAAGRGILIRDGIALEKAGRITAVLFDKTGTITAGRPEVVAHQFFTDQAALLAASLARHSTHPLSRAVAATHEGDLPLTDILETRGSGVEGRGKLPGGNEPILLRLGSLRWLGEQGVSLEASTSFSEHPAAPGATIIGLATDKKLAALFALKDTLKPGAPGVVQSLAAQHLKVLLVTGDHARTAEVIARQAGISSDGVFAEVRPEAKSALVRQLQARGERVAFVGDGLNDAPALEQADLGIAVSRASDVARDAADIVLLRSDIEAVPEALGLARATLRTIRQNLFWAFFYNAAAVPVAALGFMSPVLCAAAMGLSDVIVIGNALRLLSWRAR